MAKNRQLLAKRHHLPIDEANFYIFNCVLFNFYLKLRLRLKDKPMKKLIYTGKILTIIALVALTSCKKDTKVPFPTQSTSNGVTGDFVPGTPTIPFFGDADGILASIHVHNYHMVAISPVEQESQYGMAMFTNTTGNFASLTDADSVRLNNVNCVKSSSFSYLSDITTYSIGLGGTVTWNVKGAGMVPPISNYTFAAGDPTYTPFSVTSSSPSYWNDGWLPTFPRTLTVVTRKPTTGVPPPNPPTPTHTDSVLYWGITHPQPNHTDSLRWKNDSTTFNTALANYNKTKAQRASDSTYNLTPYASIPFSTTTGTVTTHYVTNADTVIFIFNDGAGFSYTKKIAATDSVANFRPNDFIGYPNYSLTNFTMQINLVKYYPVMVGTKKYYFLKMGSYVRYWRTQ